VPVAVCSHASKVYCLSLFIAHRADSGRSPIQQVPNGHPVFVEEGAPHNSQQRALAAFANCASDCPGFTMFSGRMKERIGQIVDVNEYQIKVVLAYRLDEVIDAVALQLAHQLDPYVKSMGERLNSIRPAYLGMQLYASVVNNVALIFSEYSKRWALNMEPVEVSDLHGAAVASRLTALIIYAMELELEMDLGGVALGPE